MSADSSFLGEQQPSSTPRGAPHLNREELFRNSTPRGVLEERHGRRVELEQGEELALGGEQLSSFLSQVIMHTIHTPHTIHKLHTAH